MVVGGDKLKRQLKMKAGNNNFIVDSGDTFITMSAVMYSCLHLMVIHLHTFHEAKFFENKILHCNLNSLSYFDKLEKLLNSVWT